MKNILVFCAGNQKARANFNASILHAVQKEAVLSSFPTERREKLLELQDRAGGFFAWGLGTTKRASYFWKKLSAGDVVLGFFEFHYRVVSQLAGKAESAALAQKLWANGDWSRILFLTKPALAKINAKDVCPPLCSTYRGTTRISDERIAAILSEYGSIPKFLEQKFGVTLAETVSPDTQTEETS
jgi:hypothetical protein